MYYIGIDSSTTATKALLMDSAGQVLAVAASEYPFETPRPLWSEQHPDLWWDGAQKSIRAVLAQSGVDPAIKGIGLTGQMHGLVLLDARTATSCARPSCGTTSAPRPSATKSTGVSGKENSSKSPATWP
jgi:sugar (pentulose or hexulose) kinase